MGPKKIKRKGKKKRAEEANEADTHLATEQAKTSDMSREQLEEHIIRLNEELVIEREHKKYFQLERDRLKVFMEHQTKFVTDKDQNERVLLHEIDKIKNKEGRSLQVFRNKINLLVKLNEQKSAEERLKWLEEMQNILHSNEKNEIELMKKIFDLSQEFDEYKENQVSIMLSIRKEYEDELVDQRNNYMDSLQKAYDKMHQQIDNVIIEANEKSLEAAAELNKEYDEMMNRLLLCHRSSVADLEQAVMNSLRRYMKMTTISEKRLEASKQREEKLRRTNDRQRMDIEKHKRQINILNDKLAKISDSDVYIKTLQHSALERRQTEVYLTNERKSFSSRIRRIRQNMLQFQSDQFQVAQQSNLNILDLSNIISTKQTSNLQELVATHFNDEIELRDKIIAELRTALSEEFNEKVHE
ncbi:hypothetical protein GJ496_011795 [Pomphorhynchus laevis]|nr:hypothetical protein GJ496_011795 [Pomphorhynchus laevis]